MLTDCSTLGIGLDLQEVGDTWINLAGIVHEGYVSESERLRSSSRRGILFFEVCSPIAS